jgi:hypothetical protein
MDRSVAMKTQMRWIGLAAGAMLLTGCAYDAGYRHADPVTAGIDHHDGFFVDYDGFYDDYYGPFADGYWGIDDYFYFRDAPGQPFRRDEGHHFRHGSADGFHTIQGHHAEAQSQPVANLTPR